MAWFSCLLLRQQHLTMLIFYTFSLWKRSKLQHFGVKSETIILRRTGLFILAFLLALGEVYSRDNYHWVHYTENDGLAQNVITSILQDKKGFMWFATWDGLSRFDGYNFKNFKIKPGDNIDISGSRIDFFAEDQHGYLWLLMYSGNVCRFNPIAEEFVNIPIDKDKDLNFNRISILPDGSVWLLTENKGAVRLSYLPGASPDSLSVSYFSEFNGNTKSNTVHVAFEDNNHNEWLLTGNGILMVSKPNHMVNRLYFNEDGVGKSNSAPFYSALDTAPKFGSEAIWAEFGGTTKSSTVLTLHELPSKIKIKSIYCLGQEEYLFVSDDNGFVVLNAKSGNHKHFSKDAFNGLKANQVLASFQDRQGGVWVQQNYGSLIRYHNGKIETYHYDVRNYDPNTIKDSGILVTEDNNGVVWIHPVGGGICCFDPALGTLSSFAYKLNEDIDFSDRLHSLFSDQQGNLWMSTRAKGLTKFVFTRNDFKLLQSGVQYVDVNDAEIRAIAQDTNGNYWISNKGGMIFVYDSGLSKLGSLGPDGKLYRNEKFSDFGAYSITSGKDGIMWIGLKGGGLVKATPTGAGKELSFSIQKYKHQQDDVFSLSNDNVYSIHEDKDRRLWVATFGGGINLVEEPYSDKLKFINSRNRLNRYPLNTCSRARHIASCPSGSIWVATTNGIVVFDNQFLSPENIEFEHYTYVPGDSACLGNNDVHYILPTSRNEVYLATFGGGLNKAVWADGGERVRFRHFTVEQGLSSDALLAIVEDRHGKIWMSTENGISCFDPVAEVFNNYHYTDYAYHLIFSEAANLVDKTGNIWFGNRKGALWFNPENLSKSTFVPPLVFTEFRLANNVVGHGAGNVLKNPVDYTEKITLNHRQNIFSIGFSAIDLRYPNSVKYRAKLDGFDSDWREIDKQRLVTYTNIPHGDYIFKVQSTNSDGVWVENHRNLSIVVRPPFWLTPLAYILYLLVSVLLVWLAGFILTVIVSLRHRVRMEHQIAEMKLDFFTNISHELRTPLTLMNAPIENLLKEENLAEEANRSLSTIQRNTNRIVRMVDQILDFVNIRNKKMKLSVEQVPIVAFANNVMQDFRYRAAEEGICFGLTDKGNNALIWADVDKLEKIIYNLISNAFKYLGKGKNITVGIEDFENHVDVWVKDDGIGIAEELTPRLFGRFERSSSNETKNISGSGIGLAVVKEFAAMHKASVYVESRQGCGSVFTVRFQKGLDHFDQEVEIIDSPFQPDYGNMHREEESTNGELPLHDNSPSATILLVDDNPEIRHFIEGILRQHYTVKQASDGLEGFEKALRLQPDLIVSDLMMPGMDGLELLRKIRDTFDTSHIPFILLTAKSQIDSKIEGFEAGADDYITKPFSPSYLMVRIAKLLEKRKQLHEDLKGSSGRKAFVEVEPSQPVITPGDELFINGIKQYLEKNLDNNKLVVDDLVKNAGVSRSVFFTKLKALTGLAPIEFVRDFRLKRAAQLIASGEFNINQVAYMVGINDARYFSKCFRDMYGMSPSDFKRKKSA
jgi:signal transduction histidine kinase/DNA-binding response OmpR family regulator/ligand-binding sensor domain-containing protein